MFLWLEKVSPGRRRAAKVHSVLLLATTCWDRLGTRYMKLERHTCQACSTHASVQIPRTHTHGYLCVTWSVWLGYGSICVHMGQNSLPTSVQHYFTLIILISYSPALVPLLIINHHWFCEFLTLNVSAQTCTVGGSDKSSCFPEITSTLPLRLAVLCIYRTVEDWETRHSFLRWAFFPSSYWRLITGRSADLWGISCQWGLGSDLWKLEPFYAEAGRACN